MAAHGNTPEILEETIRRVEAALSDGHAPPWTGGGGAVMAAARQAVVDGWVKTEATFKSRLEAARSRLRDPDWSMWRSPVYQPPRGAGSPGRPLDSYKLMEAAQLTGKRTKVCIIGDAHDDPRLIDKSRFKWLGRWVADEAPDQLVQIGDWATFDSMSAHAQPGTAAAMHNPSWPQDLESLYESIWAFEKELKGWKGRRTITEGNHENRVARYENSHPSVGNALSAQWHGAFREHKWNIRDYGEYFFIEGVGFIHHIFNAMGKPVGGENGGRLAANKLTFSVVHGHTHVLSVTSAAKIGYQTDVKVVSVGCALPNGWVEDYCKTAINGWWWGAVSMWIQDGQITDISCISMTELERKYGKG